MPFSPHEIENKKFVVAFRGYQTDEVEAFLRAVAADYRALVAQVESASPDRWLADLQRVMRVVQLTREEAEREASELRAAAAGEAAALREAAAREADAIRSATQQEAEACFAEITRQAEEMHRLKSALSARVLALEHIVFEARQSLTHVSELYPMGTVGNGHAPYGEAPSLAVETNVENAIASR